MLKFLFLMSLSANAQLPANCQVQSWCLMAATSCQFMQVEATHGLFRGVSQYSVVRKGVMSCQDYYGKWTEKAFQTDVEPATFRSATESDRYQAIDSSLTLCNSYRSQWVEAAPKCDGSTTP